jgi:hypothetical protein
MNQLQAGGALRNIGSERSRIKSLDTGPTRDVEGLEWAGALG